MASSKLFIDIYRKLPPESQQAFVEQQLAPLVDTTSSRKRDRIIRAVKRSQARYDGIPELDLKGKKREMQTLFMMLSKDDKVAFTRDWSNRDEILQEAVLSISTWMSRIWSMVYEHRANFEQAHECLLFALKGLTILEESLGVADCKCSFHNIHVTVLLKDRKQQTVKYFSFTGPRNLDQVCLWIWRDLFLCMLIRDKRTKSDLRRMLGDIEELLGWRGVEQLLYGGKRRSTSDEDDDGFYDEDEDEAYTDDEEAVLHDYQDAGTDDEYNLDSDGAERCCCRLHAKYWPDRVNEERITLRDIVKSYLVDIFRDTPDADLFAAIGAISQDSTSRTVNQLLEILSDAAGDSVDSLRAALTVHTNLHHPSKIIDLLAAYRHYLRPSDCSTLLGAITVLAESSYFLQAFSYLKAELLDSVQHIYAAVRSVFSHYAEEVNKADLAEILKLPAGSARATRIERWVDRSMSSTAPDPAGPMAFAAMMMGLPLGSTSSSIDETNLLAYVDFNKPDPDLEDLREEFKPQLKVHFETWRLCAQNMPKDCSRILREAYTKVIELMPFFKAADVVTEMTNRIDRSSKSHVSEAMLAVLDFCKAHRKRLHVHPADRRRTQKKAAANIFPPQSSTSATGSNPVPPPTSPLASASTSAPASAPAPGPIFHFFGGHLHAPGADLANPIFNNHGPNPAATGNTNAPPNPGGGVPIITTPLPPPPECNHQ